MNYRLKASKEVGNEVLYGESYHLKQCLIDKRFIYLSIVLAMVVTALLTIVLVGVEKLKEVKEEQQQNPKRLFSQNQDVMLPPVVEEFTGISLIGNNMMETGRRNSPILNWNLRSKLGNILLEEGCKIHINQTGFYYVYAQMFFFQNLLYMKNSSAVHPVMDFGIKRLVANDRVLSATVQRDSCKVACTRRLSSIVELQTGERLIIDTTTPGVTFKMLYDKAVFYVYLISKDIM